MVVQEGGAISYERGTPELRSAPDFERSSHVERRSDLGGVYEGAAGMIAHLVRHAPVLFPVYLVSGFGFRSLGFRV